MGDPKAQYNLGTAYLDGEGVRSNKRLGVSWLQKAANNGHKEAAEKIKAINEDSGVTSPSQATGSECNGLFSPTIVELALDPA